jgi:WD40 repeat protein
MIRPLPNSLEEQFARLLAAHDEQLLTGRSKPDEPVSLDLAPRLGRAQSFLEFLHTVWRRQSDSGDTHPQCAQTRALTALVESTAIGRFQIVRELGRGGGGVVYLANDPALGRKVALKVPRLEMILTRPLKRRFLREGQAAALLNHPNIVPIHEAGTVGSVCYIVSTYCPGTTLAKWLHDNPGPVAPKHAALLIQQLAEAMAHAHERGIVHRDLKPSNILLENTIFGLPAAAHSTTSSFPLTGYHPRIADFGLAKVMFEAEEPTVTGMLMGTAAYMAPEQTRGMKGVGPECDLWALGVMLYELLTGRKPFPWNGSVQIMQAIQTEEPVAPRRISSKIPRDLETICLKCLEKVPEKRYPNSKILADDLRHFLAHEPIFARPASRLEKGVKWLQRRPALAASVIISCAMLALLVGGVAWYEFRDQYQQEELRDERTRRQAREDNLKENLASQEYVQRFRRAWQEWNRNAPYRTLDALASVKPSGIEVDRRGFEWYFLFNRAQRAPKQVHAANHYLLALSPDGTVLADAVFDDVIILWDTRTWEPKGELPCKADNVFSLAFSPDGKWLASGIVDGNTTHLKLWDVANQNECEDLSDGLKPPCAVAFSPDSKTLAAVCGDQLSLWSVAPLRRRCEVVRQGIERFNCIIWSPGDRGPTLGSSDGFVLACDGAAGNLLETWHVGSSVLSLATSPDGKTVAAGTEKGVVLLPSKRVLSPIGATSVVFSADGRVLAAGCGDDRICLWDTQSWQLLDKYTGAADQTRADQFNAKGARTKLAIRSVAIMPDSKTLLSAGIQTHIKIWDISQPELSCGLCRDLREAWWVTFTPDGRTLIGGGDDHTVRLWDTSSKRELRVLRGHSSLVVTGAVSQDGKVLATGDHGGTIRLWELPQDRTQRPKNIVLTGHKGPVRGLAISPDGQTLASGGDDGTARLWDVATGRQIRIVTKESGAIYVAFQPDGRVVVTAGGHDRTVKFWDPVTGNLLGSHMEREKVRCLAYSSDGSMLALGFATRLREGTVKLVRAESYKEVAHLDGHTDEVRALAMSPDGTRLASSGVDQLISLWDINTGQRLLTIKWQKGTITGLAFSPDGQTLASASHDGSVRLWFGAKNPHNP